MSPKIYFGFELEFCLGYLMPGTPNPNSNSTKFVKFPIPEDSISQILCETSLMNEDGSRNTRSQVQTDHSDRSAPTSLRNFLLLSAARRHIGETLRKAGLPSKNHQIKLGDVDHWVIGRDRSINTTRGVSPQYFCYPMEISSLALPFN